MSVLLEGFSMEIRIVTALCLLLLLFELAFVFISIATKKRPQKIAFIRSFKKGKCAIIYFTAIPLYCVGHLYAGEDFLNAFFNAIHKIINLVVLKYDTSSIELLMADDPFFEFVIFFCFVLVGLNALLFTMSLVSQHIWCTMENIKAAISKKDKLFIFGNNKENQTICRSDKKRSKVIIDDINSEQGEKLYMERINYVSTTEIDSAVSNIFKVVTRRDREVVIIVNTKDDEKNIKITRAMIGCIEGLKKDIKNNLFLRMRIFVFGDPRYQALYEDIVSNGFGCIHYINKYQRIAIDFIDKYPLTRFMDERHIDYDESLVRDGVDINVCLIGFGNTNQQLFLTSVSNNQFLMRGESDPVLKKVKYFIFDKDEAEQNKNLNHNYYRYKQESAEFSPSDYLPLPSVPAEETYYRLDINDRGFYERIKSITAKSKNDVSFIVIAFGSDLENIDLAKKLIEKRKEWELSNLYIFVKVRVLKKEQTIFEDEKCFFIGNEESVVYNIDKITNDRFFNMAMMRNEVYDLEYAIKSTPSLVVDDKCVKENHDRANSDWHIKKSQLERESSLYCCLSLRSKLHLMGLDIVDAADESAVGLSEEEYISHYAGEDRPDTSKYDVKANGKAIVSYGLEFIDGRRRNMAIHEHYRWNSFMISKGIVPSSREQIENEVVFGNNGKKQFSNGKNYSLRRHGNLTTFEGLVEFRQIVARRDGKDEVETDVIKYDLQLLDDAFWLLQRNGYKIVRRKNG